MPERRRTSAGRAMQAFFWAISISGVAYFLLAKRRFDWFSVSFLSSCVYFLPGFFGSTAYLTLTGWSHQELNDAAYTVMVLVEAAVLSGAVISDLFTFTKETNEDAVQAAGTENLPVAPVLLFLAAGGMLLMFLTTGTALFDPDKQAMMEELNRWHILFYTAAILGCALSFELGTWPLFASFCLLILFDIFIGFRMAAAIAGISILTLWLSRQGKRRLLFSSGKQLLAGLSLALFLFFYKQVAFAVKIGDVELLRTLLADPATYGAMIMNSEPFVCQSTLNEVTAQQYSVGMGHLKGLLYQFLLFAPELGMEPQSFNDLFQPDLFPEVHYGMANNIWAEMWSSGGWSLLMLFLVVYVGVVKLFSVMTATGKRPAWRSLTAVMAAYWAFYIHRNDINYAIVLEKRVLLVMGAALAMAFFMDKLRTLRRMPLPEEGRAGHEGP